MALRALSDVELPATASRYWKAMSPVASSMTSWNVTAEPARPYTATPSHVTTKLRLGADPVVRVQTVPPAPGLRSSHHGERTLFGSLTEGMVVLA